MKVLPENKSVFIVICCISILIGCISSLLLPAKFFFDAQIIVQDPHNEIGWLGGSYPFTISFYNLLGLNKLPYSVVAIIQLPILCFILNKIGIPKDFNILTIRNIFIYISFVLLGIFVGQPSKEFLSFLIIALVVLVIQSKKIDVNLKLLSVSLIFFLTGVLFRPYYLFIPFLIMGMWLMKFISTRRTLGINILIVGILLLVSCSFLYHFLKGDFITEAFRERINDPRRGEDYAQSIIASPLRPLSYATEVFSIMYGIVIVNFPIAELKLLLKPQVLAFVVWQLCLDYFLIKAYWKFSSNTKKYSNGFLILLICISFFLIQGIFEPDLGSAIRHKMGFFPLIYYFIIYGKGSVEE